MKRLFAILAVCAVGASTGCAKFPEEDVRPSGTRLTITMTVAGRINPSYYYFVAFNTTGDTNTGPVPVIAPPWGNGWGAGAITFFVRYVQGSYRIFRMIPGTANLGFVDAGAPISATDPAGRDTLKFSIDLSQIATPELPADQLQSLTVNFIATDDLPQDPSFPGPKRYDGLGPIGNDFIAIPVTANATYSNRVFQIESEGDVLDDAEDLDIKDWSIEVVRF